MQRRSRLFALPILLAALAACSTYYPLEGPIPVGETGALRFTLLDGSQMQLWSVSVLGDSAVSGTTRGGSSGAVRVVPKDSVALVEAPEFSGDRTVRAVLLVPLGLIAFWFLIGGFGQG